MALALKRFADIDLSNPFFDTLKADYKEFSQWFEKKADATAYVFEETSLQGFLYLKVEEDALSDFQPAMPAARRLKVGTLKIDAHGTKLGERFIKKIFDHAIAEKVDFAYVTVFAKHAALVALLQRYGFEQVAVKQSQNGEELVLQREIFAKYVDPLKSYPLVELTGHRAYLLSIYPQWHTRLFPDSILHNEGPDLVKDISHSNSIHKIYLASMTGLAKLTRGDVAVIYRTGDGKGAAWYRAVATSICVMEEHRDLSSFASKEEFMKYSEPHSVFTPEELEGLWSSKQYRHVLKFTYNFALPKRVPRRDLVEKVGIDKDAYAGFLELTPAQLKAIFLEGGLDASLVVG